MPNQTTMILQFPSYHASTQGNLPCLALLQLQLCTIAITAILPVPKPAQLLDSLRTTNLTLPNNIYTLFNLLRPNETLTQANDTLLHPTNALPSDPFYETFISVRMKFYNFGSRLSVDPRFACISQSTNRMPYPYTGGSPQVDGDGIENLWQQARRAGNAAGQRYDVVYVLVGAGGAVGA